MGARWRTWLFHGLFALALTPLFHVLGQLAGLPAGVGSLGVIVVFLVRELEQMALKKWVFRSERIDYVDVTGDIAAPFAVAVTLNSFLGW